MAETRTILQVNGTALDGVYRAYQGEMTAVAARLLRNRLIPEAMIGPEDIVQAAFEGALCAPEELHKPRAYTYTALRREVNHQVDRLNRTRERETERVVEVHTATWHNQDVACLVAERMRVWDALRELPLRERTALVYTKMYGLTQSEMAQITNRHPGTIAAAVHKAILHLKRLEWSHMGSVGGGRSFTERNPLYVWSIAALIGASEKEEDLVLLLEACEGREDLVEAFIEAWVNGGDLVALIKASDSEGDLQATFEDLRAECADLRAEFIALYLELQTELELKGEQLCPMWVVDRWGVNMA